jgi:uncharacterized protein YecE (DUF72 family)
MNIWIGTSGYSYSDWVGDFYPPSLPSGQMLGYYSRFFPLVELNFTFYRSPTAAMLGRIAERTPPGFQFLVKVPRTVSHEQSGQDLPGFREAIGVLHKRQQLMGLLLQFPQATHCTRHSVDWLLTVARALEGHPLAVEFRHRSWDRPGLPGWLQDNSMSLVAVDVPDLPGLFPRGWKSAGPRAYVRLHSRKAENWYAPDKERYDYHYSDEELRTWIEALEGAEGTTQALFLFNNCHRSQAVINAQRLQTLIEEQAPQHYLVPPFSAGNPVQKVLFS